MRTEVSLITPVIELITVQEAKDFMSIDFDDWDSLLGLLIKSSLQQGEKSTGKVFLPRKVKVFDNRWNCNDKYPILPVLKHSVDSGLNPYEYEAGYDEESFPFDLKVAILQSVATGFAYRQNGVQESVSETVNASIYIFRSYIDSPMI